MHTQGQVQVSRKEAGDVTEEMPRVYREGCGEWIGVVSKGRRGETRAQDGGHLRGSMEYMEMSWQGKQETMCPSAELPSRPARFVLTQCRTPGIQILQPSSKEDRARKSELNIPNENRSRLLEIQ